MPLADAVGDVRSLVERDDPRVVDHLGVDDQVLGALQDVVIAVVAGKEARHAERDAPFAQTTVRPRVGGVIRQTRELASQSLFGGRRHGGQPAVGRIDDERRAVVDVALDQPDLTVVAGGLIEREEFALLVQRGRHEAVAEHGVVTLEHGVDLLFQRGELRVGELRFALERHGSLQRRCHVVGPDALEIGLAVGGAGRCPLIGRALAGDGCRRQRHDTGRHGGHTQ